MNAAGRFARNDEGQMRLTHFFIDRPIFASVLSIILTLVGVIAFRALPIDQFNWDPDKGAFKLNTTVAELKQMPEWVEGQQTMTGSSLSPRNDATTTRTTTTPPAGAGDSTSRSSTRLREIHYG